MRLPLTKCKKRLATVWFLGSGMLFIIVMFQTFLGRYPLKPEEAWGWFLSIVIPTLSLMIGVLATDALQKGHTEKEVDRFFFNLSFILSISYFIVILLTIFIQPFAPRPPLEVIKLSHLWLAPIQGLVTASLGAFFVKANQA